MWVSASERTKFGISKSQPTVVGRDHQSTCDFMSMVPREPPHWIYAKVITPNSKFTVAMAES